MKRSIAVIMLATILLAPSIPISVSANPLTISSATSGSFFCFSSNISMPEASVNITLICRDIVPTNSSGPTFFYEMDMQSSFVVQSENDQNTTMAFAYPVNWNNYYIPVIFDEMQFEVFVDDTEVPTLIVTLSETGFNLSELSYEGQVAWGFMMDNQFVLFNITLQAYHAVTVKVNTNATMSSDADIFDFDYCVGTARAWNGDTLEEVRIQLLNTTQYVENSFRPQESFTVAQEVDKTTGVWNLDFGSFSEDNVGVSILQKQWPYTSTTETTVSTSTQTNAITNQSSLTQTMLLVVGAGIAAVLVVVIIRVKKP